MVVRREDDRRLRRLSVTYDGSGVEMKFRIGLDMKYAQSPVLCCGCLSSLGRSTAEPRLGFHCSIVNFVTI